MATRARSCPASPASSRTSRSQPLRSMSARPTPTVPHGRTSSAKCGASAAAWPKESDMVKINVNGRTHTVDADPATPLLYVLRDHLQLNGAKFGCGLGQCGACTVMLDRQAVMSCITPLAAVGARHVRTVEGLGT